MKPKILVIGANGTIGKTVCELLKQENIDFTAFVRKQEIAEYFNSKGIRTSLGDLSDMNSLRAAMEGMNKLFLLSVTSPDLPVMQGNAARVAKEKGIEHIVKISARGASVDADFNIGRFHGIIEKTIVDLGIPFTFLQPHSFLQNLFFDRQSITGQDAIYSSLGDGKIPMIDTRDIAAVAVSVLLSDEHSGKSYVLTGPEAISYHDIVYEFTKVLGRKIHYISQTPDESYNAMISWGMPLWLVDDMIHLNKIYGANKAAEVSPYVEQILGRKPITLERFICDYTDRFR